MTRRLWLGSRTALAGRSMVGWWGPGTAGLLPFTAIWPNCERASPMTLHLPTGKVFHSGDLACFRNTWSTAAEARPVYLAIKGGNVPDRAGHGPLQLEEILLHAQADAGTFVVDGARHRWVLDLGPDDYDLPGYFEHGADGRSGRRWRYYRSRGVGHNTLSIGGQDQLPNAPATIVGSCVEGETKWAVLDLSAAYGAPPGSIRRGAALLGRQVVIQDEIDPAVCGEVVWTLHTAAEPVALAGSVARFRYRRGQFRRPYSGAGGRPVRASSCRRRHARSSRQTRNCLTAGRSATLAPYRSCRAARTTPKSVPPERRSAACRSRCPRARRGSPCCCCPIATALNWPCRCRRSTIGSPAGRYG